MPCAVCGCPVQLEYHDYVSGVPRPGRSPEWTIVAPRYYKASVDGKSAVEFYCSPEHMVQRHESINKTKDSHSDAPL